MKIALISPRGAFLSKNKVLAEFIQNSKEMQTYVKHYWAGFGTALTAIATVTPSTFDVEIIDENFKDINFNKHYDLVGVTAVTQQALRAYEIIDEFKKRSIKVVMGGIHATVMPKEAKKHADSVVIGEGEFLWPALLKDFQNKRLKQFYATDQLVSVKDIPTLRYELLKDNPYRKIWIQSSRGCPIDCEFCVASKIYGSKYRHKSVEQIIKEIMLIRKIWPNAKIGFGDDNVFKDKRYSFKLLEELNRLHIKWDAQSDISIGSDDKFLRQLREAGCSVLFIGFESVSSENLKKIDKSGWKFRQIENYSDSIRRIQSHGIGVLGAFIVGFDNDDRSIFKRTSDFIIKNNLIGAQITALTPLPGSRLRDRLEKENRILDNAWDTYTGWDVTFMPTKMSCSELQDGLLNIYRRVYSASNRIKRAKYFKKIYLNLLKKNCI